MGSILSVERRRRGADEDINVGIQACRRVAGRRRGETDHVGRRERQG